MRYYAITPGQLEVSSVLCATSSTWGNSTVQALPAKLHIHLVPALMVKKKPPVSRPGHAISKHHCPFHLSRMFSLVSSTVPTETRMLALQLRALARPRPRLISAASSASSRLFTGRQQIAPSQAISVLSAVRSCSFSPLARTITPSTTRNNSTMATHPFTRIVVEEMRTL